MRFDDDKLREVIQRITQLGLTACPICDAKESLQVDRRPAFLLVGGLDPEHDPDANGLFMVRIFCNLCGYTLLFDSEKHHGLDVPTIRLA